MYIKRHLLFFQFPGFTGCACSTGKAELSGGSLEITFAWRAVTGPEYDSALADKRVFKIYLNEDGIEGYLYGSLVYPDGFVFHGTPSSSLRPWQTPESWQNTYDSLKSPVRKRHLFNTYSTRSRRFEDSSNMQAINNQRRWSVGSDARPDGRR